MNRSQALRFALVVLLWSFTWYAIRVQVVTEVPPAWSVAYRFLLAGGAMVVSCAVTGRTLALRGREIALVCAVGLFQFVLNFNLVYEAERHVASGLPAVVFALLVIPNAVLARVFLGQPLDRRVGAGAVFGIAGVVLLFHDELTRPGALGDGALGLGLTLGGVLAASCANVIQASPLGRTLSPWVILAWAMTLAGAVSAAWAWAGTGPPPLVATPVYLGALVYLALGGSALAFAVYYGLIREIGPARAAYTSVAIPFVAMAVSTALEGYRWTAWAVAGAALAAAGIALALTGARARPAA